MFKKPFSFKGRIRRSEYVLSISIYVLVAVIIIIIGSGNGGAEFIYFTYLPLFWFLMAQGAKRCHDRGNNAAYQLIPFYGFWMLFADSDIGINKYGPNPKRKGDNTVNNLENDIKITVTKSSLNGSTTDESIIDVTGKPYDLKNEKSSLLKYPGSVPVWKHQYVYSYSEIKNATKEQIDFYEHFKYQSLKGQYYDLEGNSNYAFILLFDLIDDYEEHRNLLQVEKQLEELGEYYPKTKSYSINSLFKKIEQLGDEEALVQISTHYNYLNNQQQRYPNNTNSFEENYWGLGTKFQKNLNLTHEEVDLLNLISYYSNTFFDIKYCGTEIIKVFIALIKELNLLYKIEGTDVKTNVLSIADIIVTKQLNYRTNTESYKYAIDNYKRVIYTALFKICENEVRNKYLHKRKLNTDLEYLNQEYKKEYDNKIASKVLQLLPELSLSIKRPDENTEIELNLLNTTRWKIKFEEIANSYKGNSKQFLDIIVALSKSNKKNPSIENIFFEASKFISKTDKEAALSLYIYYLYYDLKSATFDNKQFTNTIQKSLFKTNDQFLDFKIVVSDLVKDKDLEKALQGVSKLFQIKRKKIQLDVASIKEVQQQDSGTVVLLNEYLKDEYEDESISIITHEINEEELEIEITQKNETVQSSIYTMDIIFTPIHTSTLEIFAKGNFSIAQNDLEVFAKSKGLFKNQVIESINETCYEFFDDVLIEEEEDYYIINPNYYQRILVK